MKQDAPPESLSYRAAGVNIDAGNALVDRIRPIARRTHRPEVQGGLGGFGGLFALATERYREPVLVASTDGVGTKLKLALALQEHRGVGIDLVAMCVNDLIVQGAEPLFFLDYYATGRLDVDAAAQVIEGIGAGCELAGAALLGGETAEMPGMYAAGDYDLAGFAVGVAERDRLIDGSRVAPGDVVIGIASSGPHSNGYSLIRKVLEHTAADLQAPWGAEANTAGATLGQILLAPTRIYVKAVLALLDQVDVHALAHITGGGLLENLPRVLPPHTTARIDPLAWPRPAIFDWLQTEGNIAAREMYRTFNCGVGMAVCVARNDLARSLSILTEQGETAWEIGAVEAGTQDQAQVVLEGVATT